MSNRKEVTPEYIYLTIPAEYVCVYHRIMAMLADYGEEMLKDCKANCTDKNSGVIECFNMFNAACAARHMGEDKKAALIINYVKAKINQIYKCNDNSTGYVFPIDENGVLKAFVSCNDRPRFWIDTDDLLKQNQNLGYEEEYSLDDENTNSFIYPFDFECEANVVNNIINTNLTFYLQGEEMNTSQISNITVEYYINGEYVPDLTSHPIDYGTTRLTVIAYYDGGMNNHDYIIDNYES